MNPWSEIAKWGERPMLLRPGLGRLPFGKVVCLCWREQNGSLLCVALLREAWCGMLYYRVALRGSQSATWCWKSSPLTSLDGVLGVLKLYRCMPREHIRVFLFSSPEQMEAMLRRENQGLLSTAITIDQLWDRYRVSWIEVRRLELELGEGGDHDCPYTWSLSPSAPHTLAWGKLLARRERGECGP